ncbi:MAG TPA: hypothetical protein VHA33_24315 [Candidatus Angelobacter sp.]|jgi:hypothetical protein|nr:hypothetical protein [Candidatus Angelobacter sp.]
MSTIGRRGFFKYALDEIVATFDECRGRRSFKLTELAGLSDDQLGRLVPAIMDASNVSTDGTHFVVRHPNGQKAVLFKLGSMEEDIWSRLDGQSSVRQIANSLAFEWNETSEAAFAITRRVFLQLATEQICIPCNPVES